MTSRLDACHLPILSCHRDSPETISSEESPGLYPDWATYREGDGFAEPPKRKPLRNRVFHD